MKRVVFWQNTPSPHYAPIARSLAQTGMCEVHVITEWDLSSSRKALGWEQPNHGSARLVVAPNDRARRLLEHELGPNSFHIFSGLGVYPKTTVSQRKIAQHTESTVAIVTESWNPAGIKGQLRHLKYRNKIRSLKSTIDIYLPIGRLGYDQLVRLGAPEEDVFPFAYTVDAPSLSVVENAPTNGAAFAIGFAGKLEDRKNVELLLRALAPVSLDWSLTIIGDGPLRETLSLLATSLGIDDKTRFLGAKSNSITRTLLAKFDALVLPSKFDGWGAVVNESLHVGVPVIVSDAVGASELLQDENRGTTFKSGNAMSLRKQLVMTIQKGAITGSNRRQLTDWAHQAIGPLAVSQYLLRVLEWQSGTSKPIPPWVSGVIHG